ncbi:uncharacterized protein FIBRA_07996 [Fibroporia radiculosa]|uniref:SLC41A/MgtE integral membrane domain-containing protein n=1 Tax=Fibroporia radiculosa TaxID=599839 RepID=J4GG52_9APHY|nr:uncharacterized protein FIBRA_07996 [Fibroporia radiculosa]CCM05763.1 predicted protein [Fibroporia radiculosa]
MAGAESPPLLSKTSSNSIELTELEEITVTPDTHHRHVFNPVSYNVLPATDSDDEDDRDDSGSRALLGSPSSRFQSLFAHRVDVWHQVKGIVIQTLPTLLVTTIGLMFVGNILEAVSHWKAMNRVDELIILVPVVLNLKGNLEMNLSARLGTAANLGKLDKPDTRRSLVLGNLALLQVQAAVVSFVAACVAFLFGRIVSHSPGEQAASMTSPGTNLTNATAIAHAVLSTLHDSRQNNLPSSGRKRITVPAEFIMVVSASMCSTAIARIDPGEPFDNIAPPVASCLGDLVTLTILSFVSVFHVSVVHTPIPLILVVVLTAAAIGWVVVVRRNPHVRHLLAQGWFPLFAAMIVSSGAGMVLDRFVSRYQGYALLEAVVTGKSYLALEKISNNFITHLPGLAGSVGSIFVSRLSTALHVATMGHPTSISDHTPHPSTRLVSVTLLVVSFPVQIIFLCLIYAFGWLHLPIVFLVLEVIFFCIAVAISLSVAQVVTNYLWKRDLDPDMYAMPLQSAVMDLVGQLLLVLCYEAAALLGSKVRSKTGR